MKDQSSNINLELTILLDKKYNDITKKSIKRIA